MNHDEWLTENLKLVRQSKELDDIFRSIISEAQDGLHFDGAHHKLWFLLEIQKLADISVDSIAYGDGLNCPP